MFLLVTERGFTDWDANVHPSLWWQRYLSTRSSRFQLIVYVSSHAMHSGSIVSHFQRQGIALPTSHLHYVEFCPLHANQERPTWLTAPGNSWGTIKMKCFGVKMKTDQATARLVSRLKCLQLNILQSYFWQERESSWKSRHVGPALNPRAAANEWRSSNQVQPVIVCMVGSVSEKISSLRDHEWK